MYTIGEAATRTGLSAKQLRHYESIGLLPEAKRTEAGYRLYNDADLRVLQFIGRARALGFGLEEARALVDLWQDHARSSHDVHVLASRHVADLTARIAGLQAMQAELERLIADCHGDERPECPILAALVPD